MVMAPCSGFCWTTRKAQGRVPAERSPEPPHPALTLEHRNPELGSEHDDAGVLGLVLGLDMDRDQGILDLGLEHPFDLVTDVVRLRHAHRAGHNEVKVDEGPAARMARAQVMGLQGSGRIRRDQLANALQGVRRSRLVHEAAHRLFHQAPAGPKDVEGHQGGERRIEHRPARDRHEPPEPKPSRPGPRSPAWPLGHKPSCDWPSCAVSRPEPIKLTVPSRHLRLVWTEAGPAPELPDFSTRSKPRWPLASLLRLRRLRSRLDLLC